MRTAGSRSTSSAISSRCGARAPRQKAKWCTQRTARAHRRLPNGARSARRTQRTAHAHRRLPH
eukprot:1899331-Prymnesium_polylepis.1